jgi:hypothetical protein
MEKDQRKNKRNPSTIDSSASHAMVENSTSSLSTITLNAREVG